MGVPFTLPMMAGLNQGLRKVNQQVNPSVRPEPVEGLSVHGSTSSPRTDFELMRILHMYWPRNDTEAAGRVCEAE